MDTVKKLLPGVDDSVLKEVVLSFSRNKVIMFPSEMIRRILQFHTIEELFKSYFTVSKTFLVAVVGRIQKDRYLDRIGRAYEDTLDFTKNPFSSESVLKYSFGEMEYFPSLLQWNLCFPNSKTETLYPLAITIFSHILDQSYIGEEDSGAVLFRKWFLRRLRILNVSLKSPQRYRINPWNISDEFLRKLSETEGILFNHAFYEITTLRAAVFWSCLVGKLELLKELLAKLPERDAFTTNLLFQLAVVGGCLSVVEFVSSLEGVRKDNEICNVAAYCGHLEVLKYLIANDHKPLPGGGPFRDVCGSGDVEIVEFMIEKKMVDASDIQDFWFGNRVLRDTKQHLKILDLLLGMDRSVLKNSKEKDKLFVDLFCACCRKGSVEIVKKMLEKEKSLLDKSHYGSYGFRSLISSSKKKKEILKILEDHGLYENSPMEMFKAYCSAGNVFKATELMDEIGQTGKSSENKDETNKKKNELGIIEYCKTILDIWGLELMKKFTRKFSKELEEISKNDGSNPREHVFIEVFKEAILTTTEKSFEIFQYLLKEKIWSSFLEPESVEELGDYCCETYGTSAVFLKILVEENGFDAFKNPKKLLHDAVENTNVEIVFYLVNELGLQPGRKEIVWVFEEYPVSQWDEEEELEMLACLMKHSKNPIKNFKQLEKLLEGDYESDDEVTSDSEYSSDTDETEDEDRKEMRTGFRICQLVAGCDDNSRVRKEQEQRDSEERMEFVQGIFETSKDQFFVRFHDFEVCVLNWMMCKI